MQELERTGVIEGYKVLYTDVLGTLPQVSSIATYVVMESTKDERQ